MSFCGEAWAQSTEFTSGDNHALLYARQMGFSPSGAPTVRMRIADGLTALRFVPEGDFAVMPSGTGGPTIRLRGGRVYEVTIEAAKPGAYQYGGILARAPSPDGLDAARAAVAPSQVETETVEVGAIFALRGHVFDNRESLLMTRRTASRDETERRMAAAARYLPDVESPDVYSELMSYPQGRIVLRDESGTVQIEHANLMWIDLPEAGARLFDIADESGKRGELRLNSQIVVTPDHDGRIAVVQSADVETILRGIVPAEIFASAPEAALMAQAIAARTTLVAQAGARHTADPWHLCNRQHCQVYRGLSGADPRTDAAIEKTRGQILFYGKDLVQSYYSAHCGGFSAGAAETWGLPDRPYLAAHGDNHDEGLPPFADDAAFLAWWRATPADYCSGAPEGQKPFASTKHARWNVHLTADEIAALCKKAGHDVGTVQDVEILERGASFRVTRLRVRGSKGEVTVERELPVRRLLGGLRSALFAVSIERSGKKLASVDIYGAGFGHGVGLCQTGAIGMAQRGIRAEDILLHYFPGTHVDRLW